MENKDIIRLVDCAKYRKAEKVLAALLQEKPTDFFYLSVMGEVLFCKGKYEEALSCLEKSGKWNPDFPLTIYYKGRTLLCLDRFAEAQECFDRFIGLDVKMRLTQAMASQYAHWSRCKRRTVCKIMLL